MQLDRRDLAGSLLDVAVDLQTSRISFSFSFDLKEGDDKRCIQYSPCPFPPHTSSFLVPFTNMNRLVKTEIFHKLREEFLFVVVGKDPAHHPRSDRYEFLCVCTASTFETASLRVC